MPVLVEDADVEEHDAVAVLLVEAAGPEVVGGPEVRLELLQAAHLLHALQLRHHRLNNTTPHQPHSCQHTCTPPSRRLAAVAVWLCADLDHDGGRAPGQALVEDEGGRLTDGRLAGGDAVLHHQAAAGGANEGAGVVGSERLLLAAQSINHPHHPRSGQANSGPQTGEHHGVPTSRLKCLAGLASSTGLNTAMMRPILDLMKYAPPADISAIVAPKQSGPGVERGGEHGSATQVLLLAPTCEDGLVAAEARLHLPAQVLEQVRVRVLGTASKHHHRRPPTDVRRRRQRLRGDSGRHIPPDVLWLTSLGAATPPLAA